MKSSAASLTADRPAAPKPQPKKAATDSPEMSGSAADATPETVVLEAIVSEAIVSDAVIVEAVIVEAVVTTAPPAAPPPAAAQPAAPAPAAAEPASRALPPHLNGRPPVISRASNKDETFAEGDFVVYPTHGVGRVERIAEEEIAGHKLQLIHITFEENRMTLRVPVTKARSAGLRKLATRSMFDEALAVLKGRARVKRTMWSRRAQEYEQKINSGDPLSIAEVVRDLHRNSGQPDQSFSERQIYEAAMDRLAAELAALDQTDKNTAITKLTNYLKTIA